MEMDGPFTAEMLVAGERMMFSMCPRLAAALNAALTQAIAMVNFGYKEAH